MKEFNYIYIISNVENGKGYVGTHETNNLNDGYFGSGVYLKNAIKKHGKDKFEKNIIEFFDTYEAALLNEEHHIIINDTLYPNGYNLSSTGGFNSFVNGHHNDETKKKMSISATGKHRIFSKEHKEKLSKAAADWHKNVGFSSETRERISAGNTNKICTEEARENYKRGNKGKNIGVVHSLESRLAASEKLKGKPSKNKGKIRTDEARKNMSIAAKNRKKHV